MNAAQTPRLSIQAGLYGLSFLINDGGREHWEYLDFEASHPPAIEPYLHDWLRRHQDLLQRKPAVTLVHHHPWYAWVPQAYFQPDKAMLYLQAHIHLLETDRPAYDTTPGSDRVNVYIPMVNLHNLLLDYTPEIHYYHSATLLDRYALETAGEITEPRIIVRSGKRDFQTGIWEGNRLLFFNTFPAETTDDFLYYFLFAWEKTGMDKREPDILLTGPRAERWAEELNGFLAGIRTEDLDRTLLKLV